MLRRRRPIEAESVSPAGPNRLLRTARTAAVVVAIGAACAYVVRWTYRSMAPRDIGVCVVSDFSFRLQKPNWEYQLTLWFAEVNRVFEPAGVHWSVVYRGDSYPERVQGDLESLRALLEEHTQCQADLILGFTGQSRNDVNSSVSPFAHTALIAATDADSDAVTVTRLARALAHLFAVPVSTETLITTDAPHEGVLDAASLTMIGKLRKYEFAGGLSSLPGAWERRAASALVEALTGKAQNPQMEAHRTLARAFAAGRKHPQAIAQFRKAVQAAPKDASLRLELGLELNADVQHEAALAELREAALLDPEDGKSHAAMGAILLNIRRNGEAIDELRTAARLDPRNPQYQTLLGQALAPEVGGAPGAAAAFQAALRLKPRDEAAIYGLAQLSAAPALMQDSLQALEAETRKSPASSDAHLRLGLAYAQAANVEAARREFQRSIDLDPKNGRAHLCLAQLNYMAGDYEAARVELEAGQAAGANPAQSFVELLNRKLKQR